MDLTQLNTEVSDLSNKKKKVGKEERDSGINC